MQNINISSLPKNFDKALFIKKNIGNLNFCFFYESIFSSTKFLRDFVETVCFELSLNQEWSSRLILISDELNNNAIEYGSKKGEINCMRIKILKKGLKVSFTIEVEDTGNGVYHKTSKEMKKLQKEKLEKGFKGYKSIRGRGLFMIVYKLVDKLYFKDSNEGGLIVGIKKDLF